jgi:di/tricarboxylate transporter
LGLLQSALEPKLSAAWVSLDAKIEITFLIFGMLQPGMALEKTRGGELVSHTLIHGLGGWGPLVALCIVHLP